MIIITIIFKKHDILFLLVINYLTFVNSFFTMKSKNINVYYYPKIFLVFLRIFCITLKNR